MTSENKKRKRLNSQYYLGGEKGKTAKMKGYRIYHKRDRVENKRIKKEDYE